ncbi:MAG TPA: sulfocyanin-like copper-binding protein [Candidatus Limnocylindrales bacterium]|jgi:uncharacterized cupredoxin-like copper-binding protein
MRTKSPALILAASVVAMAGACTAAAGAEKPLWTYGPTQPPVAAPAVAVATPAPTPTVEPTPNTTIDLSEWHVAAASTFKAGTVTFTIKNDGTIQHELLVFKSDLAPAAYPQESGDIVEDGPGVDLLSDGDNIDPSGSQQRTVQLTPGTYLFVCNIPGHFKAGMYTVVTVTP